VCQVGANQIDFFVRQPGLWRFIELLGFERLPFGLVERLLCERFRLLFGEELFGRLDNLLNGAPLFDRNEAEPMRPLTPIQHMGVTCGFAPRVRVFIGARRGEKNAAPAKNCRTSDAARR
jgi:hypothetical protein